MSRKDTERKRTQKNPNSLANLRMGRGRPKGVPNKVTLALKAYAGQYTTEAVDALVTIGRSVEMPPQARVAAWREILDRGNGKPPQSMSVGGDPDNRTPVRQIIHQYVTDERGQK